MEFLGSPKLDSSFLSEQVDRFRYGTLKRELRIFT